MKSSSLAADRAAWRNVVLPYQRASLKRALWQLVNTLVPYALLWYAMYRAVQVSLWLAVPLAFIAAAFLVRIFIIFHDCGHGSYFRSRRANDLVGFIAGVLTFSPYQHWRWEHAIHHAGAADLDKRGTGDVWMMTVQEYLQASRWRRCGYRLARNPLVLFVIAPFYVFVIQQRFASPKANRSQRGSVRHLNLALLGVAIPMSWLFGLVPYLVLQSLVIMLAGAAGIWLFYIQHQFEGVYWERETQWDCTAAALQGSSFYKLPSVLQWFSGNIGFHHIHHLSPRIPNYNLQRCQEHEPLLQQVKPVTLGSSFRSLAFRFWDEKNKKLVGYAHIKQIRAGHMRA